MSVSPLVTRPHHRNAAGPSPFACTRQSGTSATWVHLVGELDIATAAQLEHALAEAQADALLVVLDPRGLTFIDCAGLHVIMDAAARARSERGWLLLVGSSPVLERLLALTGSQDLVTVFDIDPEDPRSGAPAPGRRSSRRRHSGELPQTEAARSERTPQLGRLGRLRAVRDNAEAAPLPSGVLDTAWPRPSPGRGHATQSAPQN